MAEVLAWLAGLPPWALYVALAVTAAAENVFPPLPADTVVGVGAFIAARGQGSLLGAAASTWAGNVLGALAMYAAGRRLGSKALMARLGGADAEARLEVLYRRHGTWALFLSRFLPGVRAIVPPFAGALKLPFATVAVVMGVASAIWYGAIAWLGFRFGRDLETLQRLIGDATRTVGLVAAVIVALVVAVVWWRRRRSAAQR
jgi:membrane protein DedA with SNARE-associated domain